MTQRLIIKNSQEATQTTIIGLVGPSGVGKEYIKTLIKQNFSELFSEPIIATTRPKRINESLNRFSGLPIQEFQVMVSREEIIFSHQPFGSDGNWYGFIKSSLFNNSQHILTEVHIDNVVPFKQKYGQKIKLIGLIASEQYLYSNLRARGTETQSDIIMRLLFAQREICLIRIFHSQLIIDDLILLDQQKRNQKEKTFVRLVLKYLY